MNKKKQYLSLMMIVILSMITIKATSGKRKTFSINKNTWKFIREDVKNAFKPNFDDSHWLSVTIPHDYNGGVDGVHNDVFKGRFEKSTGKRRMYKGPAWYRTKLKIDKSNVGKKIFIEFEAVSLVADIYVNGKKVGNHNGGYTSFLFDITDYLKFGKENLIAVRADNSNNPAVAPFMYDEKRSFPFSFDYAVYGGIYRDVWVHITDPIKIEKVFNTPVTGGQAPSVLGIDTYVKNYSNSLQEVKLSSTIIDPNGKEISSVVAIKNIEPGKTEKFEQSESALGDIQLWSPDHPSVYKVISKVSYNNKVVDEYESVFGFRYYTLANKQAFKLNGKTTLLRGVNRHQDMEGYGYAMPNKEHWNDAKIIKEAGFNAIRHAHYPCDREFAKACDELGMMLWLEIPLSGTVSDHPDFLDNVKTQMKEMVEQYYNNPSVIVWGVGNESDRSGASETGSNKVYSELVKVSKAIDPNRPTTGCNFKYKSNHNIVDAYAPQDWGGWYGGAINHYKPNRMVGEYGADSHITNHSEKIAPVDKEWVPATKTETWSQEYICQLHEYKLSIGEERKELFPGHFVWLAFDFASPRVDRGMNPIPYMNQKGIMMHDHKTPKDVYYMYQSNYVSAEKKPIVYIVSETWKNRWETPGLKDVWVYSNCDSVVLYNDLEKKVPFGGRTKNAGPRGDTRFQWNQIGLTNNVLYAEAWYNGKIMATDTLQGLSGDFGVRADFNVDIPVVECGNSVKFTDASTKTGDSYKWIFEGGEPATSTERNPIISYANPGVYNAVLKVMVDGKEKTTKKSNVVRVFEPHDDLHLDFNLNDENTEVGYQAYTIGNLKEFRSKTYNAFDNEILVSVVKTSGDQYRSLDRKKYKHRLFKNLIDDFIGIKGVEKKQDAILKINFKGLPVGRYELVSYHHDPHNLDLDMEVKVTKGSGDYIACNFTSSNGTNKMIEKVAKANVSFNIKEDDKNTFDVTYKCIDTRGEDYWVIINGFELRKLD